MLASGYGTAVVHGMGCRTHARTTAVDSCTPWGQLDRSSTGK